MLGGPGHGFPATSRRQWPSRFYAASMGGPCSLGGPAFPRPLQDLLPRALQWLVPLLLPPQRLPFVLRLCALPLHSPNQQSIEVPRLVRCPPLASRTQWFLSATDRLHSTGSPLHFKAPDSQGCPYSPASPMRWIPTGCEPLVCEFHTGPLPPCEECVPGILICKAHLRACGAQSAGICPLCSRILCKSHVHCFCNASFEEKDKRNRLPAESPSASSLSSLSLSFSNLSFAAVGSGPLVTDAASHSSLALPSLSPLSPCFFPLGLASRTLSSEKGCAASVCSVSPSISAASSCSLSVSSGCSVLSSVYDVFSASFSSSSASGVDLGSCLGGQKNLCDACACADTPPNCLGVGSDSLSDLCDSCAAPPGTRHAAGVGRSLSDLCTPPGTRHAAGVGSKLIAVSSSPLCSRAPSTCCSSTFGVVRGASLLPPT